MPAPVRIAALGGLGEVGMNCLALECEGRLAVVDCGILFPSESLGVDLVAPDLTWLRERRAQVEAVFVTHGHEDHIGALPLLLRHVRAPVHVPRFARALLARRLEEAGVEADLREVSAGEVRAEGTPFATEFVAVTHSVPDSCALAIRTPQGLVLHSGDFKIDERPLDGRRMDLARVAALGREGVRLLLSDSTNAERPGSSLSESAVGEALARAFSGAPGRVVVACFASNVHRIQQVADAARAEGRRLLVLGRAMEETVRVALSLGYLRFPPGLAASPEEAREAPAREVAALVGGSQGEPRSALARLARGEHPDLSVGPGDLVVLSSRLIPGNERAIGEVENGLSRRGARVLGEEQAAVHASGHACEDEQRRLIALARPQEFVPIHGEYRHLARHAAHAAAEGLPDARRHLVADGEVLELAGSGARVLAERVPAGRVFLQRDAPGLGEVPALAVEERRLLAEVGLCVVVLAVDRATGAVLRGPEVLGRGVAGLDRAQEDVAAEARLALEAMAPEARADASQVRDALAAAVRRFLRRESGRRPLVLPVVLEV